VNIDGRIRIIKPNEQFSAAEHEIPEGFRDRVRRLDAGPKEVLAPPPKAPPVEPVEVEETPTELEYFVEPRSPGYFNVVDKNGKVMNEKALRAAAAEELVKSLKE